MSEEKRRVHRRSRTAQALGWVDEKTRALVPPIHTSTNYERAANGSYPGGHEYSRDKNPTYLQVESLLAELEGGHDALVFASGMAAATAVVDALGVGARVIAPERMYWTFRNWLHKGSEEGRIDLELVPNGDLEALEQALDRRKTDLVWVETPANPCLEICDIEATVACAHRAGAVVGADCTLSTPVHTQALGLGVDVVMHSATKQLNGHGDVLAGALVGVEDGPLWQAIRRQRADRGAVLGPFEAWLLLRGMRTLFLRVEASSGGAMAVAEALAELEDVVEVFYPGLASHPGHDIACRQMQGGFGCMVSFRVHGGEETARRVEAATRLFMPATSLGGPESLIEHRASVEGDDSPVPRDLLRLSIGLEDPEDLIADLVQAVAAVGHD